MQITNEQEMSKPERWDKMNKSFESKKLDWCKDELKALILRLKAGHYDQTADVVFDHVAHTGVETDLKLELKKTPTLDEFLTAE